MQKLSARERRHKAVLNKIARLTLARNKGIKAIVAAETQLPALERQARRNELPVKPRRPKPVDLVRQAAPMGMVNDGEVVVEPTPRFLHVKKPDKPKRQRKPKAETPTPQAGLDVSLTPEDRDARMASFGFRKGKRKPAPASVD